MNIDRGVISGWVGAFRTPVGGGRKIKGCSISLPIDRAKAPNGGEGGQYKYSDTLASDSLVLARSGVTGRLGGEFGLVSRLGRN